MFEESNDTLEIEALKETGFVSRSAIKHPHDLVLGHYSVHTARRFAHRMDLSYSTIKSLHVGAAGLIACLFVLRAAAMAWRPEFLARRSVKFLPHAVDTLLMLSGVWIAFQLGAAGVQGWLPAKLIGLVIYIVLGIVALKRGRTRGRRIAAALAAVIVLAYIFGVAVTKSVWGPLAGWI